MNTAYQRTPSGVKTVIITDGLGEIVSGASIEFLDWLIERNERVSDERLKELVRFRREQIDYARALGREFVI